MEKFRSEVLKALKKELKSVKAELKLDTPPNPEMGDFSFAC